MSREEGCSGTTIVVSFMLGTIAGAAAVLLLAPQARKESAERIRDFSQNIKDQAADYLDQAKEKVSSTVGRGRDFLDEKRSLIHSAVEAGKEAYQREKTKGTPEAT
jgi:gas vesicle protein